MHRFSRDNVGDAGFNNLACAVAGKEDNCRFIINPTQEDFDSDGLGNACDPCPLSINSLDSDNDGLADGCDFCPHDYTNQCTLMLSDNDHDLVPDNWDNCPELANPEQEDYDGDEVGDPGFNNDDCAGFSTSDNCPFLANVDQNDRDENGIGDACDKEVLYIPAPSSHALAAVGSPIVYNGATNASASIAPMPIKPAAIPASIDIKILPEEAKPTIVP